jgi:hypothetical protein
MDRAYQSSTSANAPAQPFPGSSGFAQGELALQGFIPTTPGEAWFDWATESIRNVVIGAGLTPSASALTQFRDAVIIIAQRGRA